MLKNQLDTPNAYRNARTCLLNALDALQPYGESLTLVGGQALHLHTQGKTDIETPELTVDADLAIDPRVLNGPPPTLEEAMGKAHFKLIDPARPGRWEQPLVVPEFTEPISVEVDLMAPASLSGGGRRGARLGAHGKHAAGRTPGLDAALVDQTPMLLRSLNEDDPREYRVRVAGPGALVVAKLYKIRDRLKDGGDRVKNKDSADLLRLLVADTGGHLAETLRRLREDDRSRSETAEALGLLRQLGGRTGDPLISMAQQALAGFDDPEIIASRYAVLIRELLEAVDEEPGATGTSR